MTRPANSHVRTALIAGALALGVLACATAARADAPPSSAELRLEQRVDELAEQLQAVKAELARLKAERATSASVAAAPAAVASAPTAPTAPPTGASPFANLNLWGYGEVYYTHPVHTPSDTQADLARAVFGIGYQFDPRTNFNSEYEVEHAVSSSSDVGEFEVEQFFVDHRLTPSTTLRGGLFLMPFGLLNEHHEPTTFYGVQRNFVETLIIPSTWREGGIELNTHGQSGLAFSAGLTTGFDLSKWEYAPQFPLYRTALDLENTGSAPLQATHQELALANGAHPSGHVALNYTGIPGLRLGGAIFVGDAVKVPAAPNAPSGGEPRVTLWEGHARWQPAGFDLSGVYARGAISHTAAANAANVYSPNPIPSAFYGYFLQAAYAEGWAIDQYRLSPFVRYEYYDLGSSYDGPGPVLPLGTVPLSANAGDYGPWPRGYDRVWTAGANFFVTPNVVVKLDYQSFDVNRDFSRLDLGLGLAF
jgi:hypothetical protein